MEYIASTLSNLIHQTAFFNLTWGNYVMIAVACFFLYLAIRHEFEPLLLTPIAFGMLLVNIYPDIMLHAEDAANGAGGLLYYFYKLDELAKAFLQNVYIWGLLGEAGTLRLGRDELIVLIRESHKFISKYN